MHAQLEAGNQVAVGEQGAAQAGAQREHQFHAMPLDGAIAGDIGVVGHTHRLLPALDQPVLQGETCPIGMQVVGQDANAALDDAGHADGDAVEARQQSEQFIKPGQHRLRRGHGRSGDAQTLAHRHAGSIQQHGLQPRAANIDGQRDGVGWVGRNHRGGGGDDGDGSGGHGNFRSHLQELYCLRAEMQCAG